MEQFNPNTYKKQSAAQQFTGSCLGKIIICAVISIVLLIVAAISRPSDSYMRWQMEDNITECIASSDSIESDIIDDYVGNIGRIFTHADSTEVNPELWETYKKLNKLEIYPHMFFKTARVINNIHPEGVRVGIGIFGIVIPTVKYSDLLMNTGAVRGDYNQKLIKDATVPDMYTGDNPNIQPFHYKGNPDD